jgi:hypothetical protein
VALSLNHGYNRNATMPSVCIDELLVTDNNKQILEKFIPIHVYGDREERRGEERRGGGTGAIHSKTDNKSRCAVSTALRPLYRGGRIDTHCTGGCLALGDVWMVMKISAHQDSTPGPSNP